MLHNKIKRILLASSFFVDKYLSMLAKSIIISLSEWENMGLCVPGDAIGSAAWRCEKFGNNCHACLVDYANQSSEYVSFHIALSAVKISYHWSDAIANYEQHPTEKHKGLKK